MKLITYEAIFDEELKGVFGISLVESPATKETFIQLSEQEQEALKETEIKLATINEEQRLLVGLVLEPNSPVYRNQDGEEFNIIFSEDTITKLAHNFFISDSHKNSSIEHSKEKIENVTFVESWIVADPKKDKTNVHGLEYPVGSWIVAMKVNNDEAWDAYVESGKVTGFSIDAIVKLKEVKNKTELSMHDKIIKKLELAVEKLTAAVFQKKEPEKVGVSILLSNALNPEIAKREIEKVELKLGQVMMEGGEIIFEYDGETPEVGGTIFAVDPTDTENKIPAPIGKYPLEDGSTLVVDVEGVIGSITPKEEEAAAEEAQVVEPVAAAKEAAKEVTDKIQSILIKYQEDNDARVKKLETEFAEMKSENVKLKEEIVEMSGQPNAKPKTGQATIDFSKMTNFQKLKYNEEKGKR